MTRRKPWPEEAERARLDVLDLAKEAGVLLAKAQRNLEVAEQCAFDDPKFAELAISKAQTKLAQAAMLQEKIQRLLSEAKNGSNVLPSPPHTE